MSVIAEGNFTLAVESMRLGVASSKTYQEVTSSVDESQALGTVIVGGVWEEEPPEKARAIVRLAEGSTLDGSLNTTAFTWTIPFTVTLELPIPAAYVGVFADAYKWFMNRDGAICKEILNNCRQRPGDIPNIMLASHTIRPGIYDPDEKQGYYIGVSEYLFEALGEFSL